MTKKENAPSLKSKLGIFVGIGLLVFTPFWFHVGRTMDTSWLGLAGIFYGWCSAVVWLLICVGVIVFGIFKYSGNTK